MDKIKSIREQLGASYNKPDKDKVAILQKALQENIEALDYLKISRNLSDDTIKNFKLGYDADKNAISIPIFKRGECINIKYRLLKPTNTKYTQEKGCEVWVFNEEGIDQGIKRGGLLICEGEFDAMSAWQSGFKNVISPASGKDSFGMWIESVDNIPRIYIAYDNDKPGKSSALTLSARLGTEKCYEVCYPEGIKDANDYFKLKTGVEYRELIKEAKPFYRYQFKGLGDIIEDLRDNKKVNIKTDLLPDVNIGTGWLISISADTNIGKTSYVMNLADDFTSKGLPTLVFPFERGSSVVGERFLQVKFNSSQQDFKTMDDKQWKDVINDCVELPLYFSMPAREELTDTILKAKRIFDIKVVIVDHLDYLIRRSSQREDIEIRNTLHELKRIAEDHDIIFIIVTHIKNIQIPGAVRRRQPTMDDVRGSSAIKQDSECVVILKNENENSMTVDVQKNKGKMTKKEFSFNVETGRLSKKVGLIDNFVNDKKDEW